MTAMTEVSIPVADSATDGPVGVPVGATAASETVSLPPTTEQATQYNDLTASEAVTPDPARDEAERMEPVPTGPITLANGAVVEIVPLKLRETMKLLKIVTRGAGGVLEQLMGEFDLNDPTAFAQTFGALILLSIPEAENEVVTFLQAMVRPANWDAISPQDRVTQVQELEVYLSNPELEDTISIVERVVRRESEDIRNLGKRLNQAFSLGRRVGELGPEAK